MKALFIGGTGTISSSISALCVSRGWDLTLLNRGNADARMPQGARAIHADIRDEAAVRDALKGQAFDVVADFIAYTPEDVARDHPSVFRQNGTVLFYQLGVGVSKAVVLAVDHRGNAAVQSLLGIQPPEGRLRRYADGRLPRAGLSCHHHPAQPYLLPAQRARGAAWGRLAAFRCWSGCAQASLSSCRATA